MEITITGIIVIQTEINKIARRISHQFDLSTGYKTAPVVKSIDKLRISEAQRGLLIFLGVTEVIGESSMEYNDYTFVAGKKKYIGHDYGSSGDLRHEYPITVA